MDNGIVVFAGDVPASTIGSRVLRGELRQLGRGLYTTDTTTAPEVLVLRNWAIIAGHLYPDAVVTDRSALTGGPTNGFLYLAHDRRAGEYDLPGLTILARRGAPPQEGDFAIPGGLRIASRGRALAENARPSRSRNGRPRRTLDADELAAWVDHLCQFDNEDKLRKYRADAEGLADIVGTRPEDIEHLSRIIGAALQTQTVTSNNAAINARQRGIPHDPVRLVRFDTLIAALRGAAPQYRSGLTDDDRFRTQSFFEAYFSNFIEGTEFTLDEARALVFEDRVPVGRTADGHDVVGTFRIVADAAEMSVVPSTPAEFVDILRGRHGVLMAGRPETEPGRFKERANRAGNTDFVAPNLVVGTLHAGFERLAALDTAWERAVYIAFVVAEVHPFNDGNGRIARIMMNAELVAGRQSKIIVPTGARNDYLSALRLLSRTEDPSSLVKVTRFLHDYTSQIDWSSNDSAEAEIRATHGFDDERDDAFRRIVLLRPIEDVALPAENTASQTNVTYVEPYVRNGRLVSGYAKPRRPTH